MEELSKKNRSVLAKNGHPTASFGGSFLLKRKQFRGRPFNQAFEAVAAAFPSASVISESACA